QKSQYDHGISENEIENDLSFDCNLPYKFARSKLYLWLAKAILVENSGWLENGFEKSFLTCRLVLLWQYLLKDPAIQLKKILNTLVDIEIDSTTKAIAAEAYIERMYAHLMYGQVREAKNCLESAMNIIQIKVEMVGAMGRRTKFQTVLPQLIAVVKENGDLNQDAEENESVLPRSILLSDDSLLETVSIDSCDPSVTNGKFSSLSLACVLASCALEQKIQSTDDTVIEKCCSYLNEVIAQRRNWALQASALLQRSEFEKTRSRRVQRACMQLELLSELMVGTEDEVDDDISKKRLLLLLASGLKPFWYVQSAHAELLCSIGCTSEALAIYEKQENWNLVIQCYQSLGQLEKAERLVRDLLAKDNTRPAYWCLLGDILHDENAYEKAIEVSNGRSFQAHRSLGMLMLHRNIYDKSFTHLKRSLEIQPINANVWFNLGCCASKLEKWEESAKANRECVRYEPAHFQAWNNLAVAYERLNDLEKAKRLLKEALKLNFDSPKLRENYMVLCVRTHDISSAITSYHVLLDSNKQYKDEMILISITKMLLALKEEDEYSTKSLIDEMCGLLDKISSQQTCSSVIWECYADLKQPNLKSNIADYEVYGKLLERSFRSCYNKKDWYKNEASCLSVLKSAKKLLQSMEVLSKMKNGEKSTIKLNIRMTIQPVISSIEKSFGIDAVESSHCDLKKLVAEVKNFTETIMSSNEQAPTTSITSATLVTALPITVQAASNNSAAYANLSVGELLQKHRIATVPSRNAALPSITGNRFPIKPFSQHSCAESTLSQPSAFLQNGTDEDTSPNLEKKPIFSETASVEAFSAQMLHLQPNQVTASSETSLISSSHLDDLIRQIDPTSVLDDSVKVMLSDFVEDFVDQAFLLLIAVIDRSCKLARHRGSEKLETKDVEFVLRRYFNCSTFPSCGSEIRSNGLENIRKSADVLAHKQRMALIKKTLKKP
ncbi:unnamed protein product, partial [Thelazia callipaeda]|uniref:Transcription initiation factor TFIID subunit 12 n=1 Tax=Thelazia callipaeda TaxID=103827 RepID=A0A158RAQ5_THECL